MRDIDSPLDGLRSPFVVRGWSPLALFAGGEKGLFIAPSFFSSLYTDDAGTTPVASPGDVVGMIKDQTGNLAHATQATFGKRPLYQVDAGGLPYLAFDGAATGLSTASIDFSVTDKVTIIAGIRKASDAGRGIVVEASTSADATNGTFALSAPAAASATYAFVSRGTGAITATSSATYAAPITKVVTAQGDISGDVTRLRINGVQDGENLGNQFSGPYTARPLYIGARNNASLYLNGRIYGLIVLGRTATATEIARAEVWMAAKCGVTLA